METFINDNPCCYQWNDGWPLSAALTQPFECETLPCCESDFALVRHPQNFITGRRFRRDYFNVYHPNACYGSCCCLPAIPCGSMHRCVSRDGFFRNLGSVTMEEQVCRPMVTYVRTVSPIIRQLKVRPRPSSCVDLRNREKQEKHVDVHREERYEYNYNFNFPNEPPKLPTPPPPPVIVRPPTKDTGVITDRITKRPLTMTETERFDRYEHEEKIKKDQVVKEETKIIRTVVEEPTRHYYEYHDTSGDEYQQSCRKAQRKDFIQRMHVQNGTTQKTFNASNTYADLGNNYVNIQSVSQPRETIVRTTETSSSQGFTPVVKRPLHVEESSGSRFCVEESSGSRYHTETTPAHAEESSILRYRVETTPAHAEESSILRYRVDTT
ncbi:unnamed protein product [Rotaria sp. Silwood1]|nr:unnamed protein product [Rotaria sp. Silwood1]CAF3404861.1 unnamed protein product [Rotaria sp. Silwood1]CAF4556871.1 unnamed protein product [Rotaria sp. Silwood1]CAF4612235.1 unnamed protein product [Rotaria sp. Silwood1]